MEDIDHGARCEDHVGEVFRPRCEACDAAAVEQAREAAAAVSRALQPLAWPAIAPEDE